MDQIEHGELNQEWEIEKAPGREAIKVLKAGVKYNGDILDSNTPFDLIYEFWNDKDGLSIGVNPHVFNDKGICLFNVETDNIPLSKGYHRAVFHVPGGLFCEGTYTVENMFCNRNTCYFLHRDAHQFEVLNGRDDFYGNYLGVYYPAMITNQYSSI